MSYITGKLRLLINAAGFVRNSPKDEMYSQGYVKQPDVIGK